MTCSMDKEDSNSQPSVLEDITEILQSLVDGTWILCVWHVQHPHLARGDPDKLHEPNTVTNSLFTTCNSSRVALLCMYEHLQVVSVLVRACAREWVSECVRAYLQVTRAPHGLPVHRYGKSEQASGCASLLYHRKARVQVKTRTHTRTHKHKQDSLELWRHCADPL